MSSALVQGSQEWLEMRKNYIGASDAPVIMGVSPYKTEHKLWEEKLGISNETVDTFATRYGHAMEDPARKAYEEFTKVLVVPEVVFHKEKKFMMASLDGLSLDGSIAVEIKNPCSADHEIAKNGEIPKKYFPQLQHQIAVLGVDMIHYFSYRSGDFALVEVKKCDRYIDQLYEAEEKFWDKVVSFEEPNLSDKDYFKIDDPEWNTISSEWKSINAQIKALEAKEKEYRKSMIDFANDRNVIGNGLTLTKITRKGNIDYGKISELKGIDLEKYRKSPTSSWRIC